MLGTRLNRFEVGGSFRQSAEYSAPERLRLREPGVAACAAHSTRAGAFDDAPSATHDRGHAGTELGAAHPGHVYSARLPVCPSLSQVTGSAGSGRNT